MIIFSRFKIGLITVSLLVTAMVWAPVAEPAPKVKPSDPTDNSDLNSDKVVDYNDLVIFSTEYLGQDVEKVEWCDFLDATTQEADLYGRTPDYYIKHFGELLSFTSDYFGCGERSDLNNDQLVNARDLMVFSETYARQHFLSLDWCTFLQGVMDDNIQYTRPGSYYLEHFGSLLLYIQEKYRCSDRPPVDLLSLKNNPKFLTRIVASGNLSGDYYVTDAKVGSVFIYDSNLVLSQELKGLATPLGVAVNASGHILVGNKKRNNVEVYDSDNGEMLATFGETELEMPTAITVDFAGNIYVTDSRSITVYVYDSTYQLVTHIGEPGDGTNQLSSALDSVLSQDESEIYILDGRNKRIQVFDLEGNFLRSVFLTPEKCGWFSCNPLTAKFTRSQALEMDLSGRLHVLDIFDNLVVIIDPQTGAILGRYGSFGQGNGQFLTPMDLILETDRALVTDGSKNKIESLVIPVIP